MPEEEKKFNKKNWLIIAVLGLAVFLIFFVRVPDGLLHVYFLDVGQGDAEFIQAPNGNQILVDGGPDNKIMQELSRVMPFYDHSIDLVILTHPHADHVTGLDAVLKRYQVGQILENFVSYNTPEYAEWNRLKSGFKVTEAKVGQKIDLGGGVSLAVLYPYQPGSKETWVRNPHDYMVVVKLTFGGESIVLAGDMEAKIEQQLIKGKEDLAAQFLKVGHHGSKTSTSESFLKKINPLAAFIEAGAKNRYGLPAPEILQRLEDFGIKYYRTDTDGATELILDSLGHYKIAKL